MPNQPQPVVDPLADLRAPEDERYAHDTHPEPPPVDPLAGSVLEAVTAASEPDVDLVAIADRLLGTLKANGVGLVTQEAWDAARAEVITAWHADTTSVGFLHKGGNCGCRYLAGVALTAVQPVQAVEPEVESEPEGD